MPSALVPMSVPGATLAEVVDRLGARGLVGAAVDGGRLGLAGVVLARVAGDDHEVWVRRDPDDPGEGVGLTEIAAELADRWPGTLVGADVFDRHDLFDPVLASVSQPRASVAVTPRANLALGAFASASGTTFHQADVDDRLVIGVQELLGPSLDVLVDALGGAKGRSVVLWKVGDQVALHALRKGRHAAAHVWTVPWTPFGHRDLDDLRDPQLTGDAQVFGDVLGLTEEQVSRLQSAMGRQTPDLGELASVLGLPPVVVDVLERRTVVAALPGATTIEPRPPREDDEGRQVLRAGGMGTGFVLVRLLLLLFGVALVAAWLRGGALLEGVAGLALVISTLVILAMRWRTVRREPG